jgi:4-hydroxythreonine-4-phosphate dehydrogenase
MISPPVPAIVISSGEPAGIGPDIVLKAAQHEFDARLAVTGCPRVLATRARQLGLVVDIEEILPGVDVPPHQPGKIYVIPVPVLQPVTAGQLDRENARHVIDVIDQAVDLCKQGQYQAMVTAPVHKGVINDSGIPFTGHTEWIAERTGSRQPVMMLANNRLRVCLATTHLPLNLVAEHITDRLLLSVVEIMHRDIGNLYGVENPTIVVCGLNPHAGEGGHLGREEIDVIIPALETLKARGYDVHGPVPADTVFTLGNLEQFDAVLAMYHDQGLPVIKHSSFGEVVNITLGLPIVRTSVDHGTALDLAGTGKARESSLVAATRLAIEFAINRGTGD